MMDGSERSRPFIPRCYFSFQVPLNESNSERLSASLLTLSLIFAQEWFGQFMLWHDDVSFPTTLLGFLLRS